MRAGSVGILAGSLETTGDSTGLVALDRGPGSVTNLRPHFRRALSTTSTAYRRTFGRRAPYARARRPLGESHCSAGGDSRVDVNQPGHTELEREGERALPAGATRPGQLHTRPATGTAEGDGGAGLEQNARGG